MKIWYFLVHSHLTHRTRIVREAGVTSLAARRLAHRQRKLMPHDEVIDYTSDVQEALAQ